MTAPETMCDYETVTRFFENQLSEPESHEFELHLDKCESCQQKLTGLAAESSLWNEVRESLHDEDSSPDMTEPLSFLNPTDNPRMLGRFGGYEIAGLIGQGGMGLVLKGFDESLNRYSAIKVLAPQLATRGSARNRFAREAQAAAAVVHDNVIAIHGVSEAAGLPFLVMPYVRGESLQKRLDKNGAMNPTEIVRIAHQIASGLAAAHKQGLVHRDIKPANILLPEGVQRVLITDFGLARAVDDSNLTGTGTIAGTPQFMSPEQACGDLVDTRSDLFSLGTVLYSMCTGRNPFRASNPYGVIRRIIDDEPRSVRELNPDIPDWLERIVQRLHAKSPDDRFQSASELAELLEKCLAHLQNPTVPLPLELSPMRVETGTRWMKTVIGLLAGAGVVACVLAACFPNGLSKSSSSKSLVSPADIERSESTNASVENQDLDKDGTSENLLKKLEANPAFKATLPAVDIPESLLPLQGVWVVERVNRLEDDANNVGEFLKGVDKLVFHGSQAYLLHDHQEDGNGYPAGQWRNVSVDASQDPVEMSWMSEGSDQPTAKMIYRLRQNSSMTGQLTLALGDGYFPGSTSPRPRKKYADSEPTTVNPQRDRNAQVVCFLRRWEFDSRKLNLEVRKYRDKSDRFTAMGKKLEAENFNSLAQSYQRGMTLADRWLALRLQEVSEGLPGVVDTRYPKATAEIQVGLNQEAMVQKNLMGRNHLFQLNNRLTALREEGNFIESLAVEFEILERLNQEDTDHSLLGVLRQQVIEHRIKREHDSADQIEARIAVIEAALAKRYQGLERIRSAQGQIALRVKPLLDQVEELFKTNQNEQGLELQKQAESITREIELSYRLPRSSTAAPATTETDDLLDAKIAYHKAASRLSELNAVASHSEKLFQKGFVTKQQVESDHNNVEIAKLNLSKAKNRLRVLAPDDSVFNDEDASPSVPGELDNIDEKIARLEAIIESLTAQIKELRSGSGENRKPIREVENQIEFWQNALEKLKRGEPEAAANLGN